MKQSNTYIFLYSSAMVVIVAAVLSVVATVLRPYQELNIEIAKKLDILRSVDKAEQVSEVRDRNAYVEEEYERYIVDSYVIDYLGERQEDVDAFAVNMRDEMRKPLEERNLPVFVARDDDGRENYIFPVHGRGLWGPLFGYVALEDDFNTIFGVILDHESETPGLGAEISAPFFEERFRGKKLFDDEGEFVSVRITKPGTVPPGDHNVDGISGGTITSKGVEEMLYDVLGSYKRYLENRKNI